jgi:hypothetical protein
MCISIRDNWDGFMEGVNVSWLVNREDRSRSHGAAVAWTRTQLTNLLSPLASCRVDKMIGKAAEARITRMFQIARCERQTTDAAF